MNQVVRQILRGLQTVPKYGYITPPATSETHHHVLPPHSARPHRQTYYQSCPSTPQRNRPCQMECKCLLMQGVPITFNTHWRDEGGFADVETAIHVHEALEKEFGIDIKDRHVLITDVHMAYHIVTQCHDAY